MTYSRQWMEEIGSEDAHGRAIWCLGKAVAFLENPGHLAMSTTLFNKALRAVENFHSPRAIAFCLVGMHAYLDKFSGDSDVRRIRKSWPTGFSISLKTMQQTIGPGLRTL
jgi:hypothetical protein